MRVRLLALFFFISGTAAIAQDTGWINGSVVDQTGAAVAKATVNLMLHGGAKPVAIAVTTPQGLFTLQTLRPVYYDLTIDAAGFQQYKLDNVKVDPSRPTDLPKVEMKLATATTTVSVTASLETVQTTSPEISTTFTTEQLERLPVADRDPLAFISTQAGVSSGMSNGLETDINGQRSSFSNVTLDGINIQDNGVRTGDLDYSPNLPLLSQVQEFTVITSNQGAASSGGASQVNFSTPSGGNKFHGSAFWQNRNSDFAANDFFDNQDGNGLPRLNLNQAGANLGGPIRKDKLFFFGTYEAYRLKSQTAVDATILTGSARQGIFKYITSTGQVAQQNILTLAGLPPDPVIANDLKLVPGPSAINNFRTGDSLPGQLLNTAGDSFLVRDNRERDNVTGKLDYYINATNSLTATYAWNRDRVDRPDIGFDYSPLPVFQNDNPTNFLAAAWRSNPRPTLTNEVRLGFNLSRGSFGYFPGVTLPSYLLGGTAYTSPDPGVNASTLAQGRYTRTYSIQDNASWTHGRHTLKFGAFYQGDWMRSYDYTGTLASVNVGAGSANQAQYLLSAGQLRGISPLQLDNANSMLATLAGLLDNASQQFNVTGQTSGFSTGTPYLRHFTYSNLAFYAQDEWKIKPTLTLTAALRWDYYSPVNERDSLEVQPLSVGTPQQSLLNPNNSLYFTGNSIGRPFYQKDLNNFGPSVGLAWDPFGKGNTSIRAGYSINYVTDEAVQVAQALTGTNPGLQTQVALFNLTGFVSTDRPTFASPGFEMPLSYQDAYTQNPAVFYAMMNPSLKTPYVQQWNFSIQHEVKNIILEGRYIGNHATKLLRAFDYNQERIPAAFLTDFLNARQNGFLAQSKTGSFDPAYNPAIPGSKSLPTFNQIFGGGFLEDGLVQSDIQNGEVSELGYLYQVNGLVGTNGLDPLLNFFPNYNALSSLYLTNYSSSSYNSLQLEARRRFADGLEFQTNFTWEKWLSDAAGTDQLRFDPFMDINNPKIERARTPTDLTYQFKTNVSYDLPLGEAHRLHSRMLNRLIGGWTVSSSIIWNSGPPFPIFSGLGTFLREDFSGHNEAIALENMGRLDKQVTFRMSGSGPYIVPASAIAPDGRGVAPAGQAPFNGQLFFNPGPLQIGTLQRNSFDGPQIFNMDAKIQKMTHVTERIDAILFMEALNALNHPNFIVGSQDINSTQFGKVTSEAGFNPRQIQLGLKVTF